jgi:hypothetical protein
VDDDFFRQTRSEIAVELDCVQCAHPAQHWFGKGALSRPDLDDEITWLGADGLNKARNDTRFVQEMLAEPFTRAMRARWQA